jgi:hypothetical protein
MTLPPLSLGRLLRPKEILRVLLLYLVVWAAYFRMQRGQTMLELAPATSSFVMIAAVLVLLVVVTFWHYALYELIVLRIKDQLARRLNLLNYRHWMNSLPRPAACFHFDPEELYGYLKWECLDFRYPHRVGTVVTPVLHTLYWIPVIWLPTSSGCQPLTP